MQIFYYGIQYVACRVKTIILFIVVFFFVQSCTGNEVSKKTETGTVTVIIENCPDQKNTTEFAGHLTQIDYSTINYIDTSGVLINYDPMDTKKDTIIIPTYNGYAEIMHLYKAIEYDTFLLKDGDIVRVTYDLQKRPRLTSSLSELYTFIYNLPYTVDGAIQSRGYHIKTILTNQQFVGPYRYYKDAALQRKYPSLKQTFKERYVDLDSLKLVYERFAMSFNSIVDSLSASSSIEPEYSNYLKKSILLSAPVSPQDVVRSDSLMHYISNHLIAQKYCAGEDATVLFDEITKDTIITEFAKKGLLKKLTRRIVSGESGWHLYPKAVVKRYVAEYYSITGDPSFDNTQVHRISDLGMSLYDALLEDKNGKELTLKKIIDMNKGNWLYVDVWASWCPPCRAQMPKSNELQQKLSNAKIRFLFLSIDKDARAWQVAVNEESYAMKHTYRFVDPDNNFTKGLQIRTVPRYLIINPKGEIVNPDADRPSSPKIENELKRLLDEKQKTDQR